MFLKVFTCFFSLIFLDELQDSIYTLSRFKVCCSEAEDLSYVIIMKRIGDLFDHGTNTICSNLNYENLDYTIKEQSILPEESDQLCYVNFLEHTRDYSRINVFLDPESTFYNSLFFVDQHNINERLEQCGI